MGTPPRPSHSGIFAATARVSFSLTPQPGPVAPGAAFQVPVVLTGGADIASVPLQISYDPAKLSLVNVDKGDFLSRDGQAVALVHRDDGPGSININASRPPGAAGVNGAGRGLRADLPGQGRRKERRGDYPAGGGHQQQAAVAGPGRARQYSGEVGFRRSRIQAKRFR
jgi:hypothetical protein